VTNALFLPFKLLAACCAAAAGIWTAAGFMLHAAEEGAVRSASAANRNLARSLAEYERSSVQAIDLSLRYLREEWIQDRGGFAAAVARLDEHLRRERVIQVAVVDREGWIVFSKLPQPERLNFADRDYFQLQKASAADELHISSPVFGRITNQWAIQYSRPLRDPQGRFDGLIVMAVPPPALELVYRDFDLGAGGLITLVRSDGAVLARSSDFAKAVPVRLAGNPGLGPGEPPAGEYRGAGRVDGIERLLAWRKVEDYPLTLYVGQSMEAVLAPYRAERRFIVAGAALATVLLLAVAVLLAARARDRAAFLEARERLMLDLHDGCIQSIYAIGLGLENTRRLVEREPGRAAQAIADAGANLNLVIQDLRAFIAGGVPAAYPAEAFAAEMRRLLPQLGEGGPSFSLDIDPAASVRLRPGQAEQVLRIAGEAVSNILRHANARTGRIALSAHGRSLRLEVVDDGIGLGPRAAGGLGLGLNHIRARAQKLGGRAIIESPPGGGTRIAVEWPFSCG
jgi:signal transduction histidine kinase